MPDKIDEILFEIRKLSIKLYGENSFEGDITEIKTGLKDHSKRIRRIELIIAGSAVLAGGATGLVKLLSG